MEADADVPVADAPDVRAPRAFLGLGLPFWAPDRDLVFAFAPGVGPGIPPPAGVRGTEKSDGSIGTSSSTEVKRPKNDSGPTCISVVYATFMSETFRQSFSLATNGMSP